MRRLLVYLLINIVILICIFGCSTTKPTDTVIVDILIDTYNDMSPLGASVTLQNNKSLRVFGVEEIRSSVVTFDKVPVGTYSLTVSLDGYHPYIVNTLTIESSIDVLVTLTPANIANVTIIASTSDGGSVTGAEISLEHSTEAITYESIITGNANSVMFPDVDFGVYTLIVSLAGYQTYVNGEVSIQSSMELTITLAPVITVSTVNIAIGASDARSIVGAVVSLVNNTTGTSHTETISENVNNVLFSNVTFGMYTLNVAHQNYYPYLESSFLINKAMVDTTIVILSANGVVLPSGYAWVGSNEVWVFGASNIFKKYIVVNGFWTLDSSMTGAIYYIEENHLYINHSGDNAMQMTFAVGNGVLTVNIYYPGQLQKTFEMEWFEES